MKKRKKDAPWYRHSRGMSKIGIWFEREIETGAETTRQTFLGNTADIAGLSREWFSDSCADASLLPFFASTMVCLCLPKAQTSWQEDLESLKK